LLDEEAKILKNFSPAKSFKGFNLFLIT